MRNGFALAALLISSTSPAMDSAADMTLVSDYVWRGITQSQGGIALQSSLDFELSDNVSFGVWGSTVDFTEANDPDDGANIELNAYVQFQEALSDGWTASAQLVRYFYPGTHSGVSYDYNELAVGLEFEGLVGLSMAFSNDAMATGSRGLTYELWGSYPIAEHWAVNATVGHADLGKALGDAYQYYEVSLVRDWENITVTAHLTGTVSAATTIWDEALTRSRGVVSVTTRF